MKTLLTSLLIIIYLNVNAQSEKQVSLMIGYKAIELGYSSMNDETECIYGFSVSALKSDVAEKRANNNDKGKTHEFKTEYVPAVFALLGAKFDDLKLIGKLGVTQVEQEINKKPTKDIFLAAGFIAEYSMSDKIGVRASYDSVNAVMAGISYKF